jgi:hypothetical protein
MKSKLNYGNGKYAALASKLPDASALSRLIGEGVLARVATLLSKRGVGPQAMHSVIDSATGPRGGRALSAARFARRVFFDYPEILKEWHTNPRFTDATGRPATLPLHRGRHSFDALVRQVASRADPTEALIVLTKTQAVVRIGKSAVRARNRVFNTSNSNSLNAIRMFCVVDAMLTMVEKNVGLRARDRLDSGFYERAATNRSVDSKCIGEFREFLREQGDDFMQTVDDWLSAHSISPRLDRRRRRTLRVGTGVYMFASN